MPETNYPTYADLERVKQIQAKAEQDHQNAQFGGTALAAPNRTPAAMEQFKRLDDASTSVSMATEQLEARLGYVLRSAYPLKDTGEKNAQPVSDAPIAQTLAGMAEHLYAQAARLRDITERLEI